MALDQFQLSVLGATRINVGLSACIKLNASAYQYSYQFKILAGSGTLEIIQCPVALSGTSLSSGNAWGTGYAIGASEIIQCAGSAVAYLVASSATMTIGQMIGFSSGATVI